MTAAAQRTKLAATMPLTEQPRCPRFVLDGSNLARLLPGSCLRSIDHVLAALARRHPGHACLVLCDPSLHGQIAPAERSEFERRLHSGEWQETPPGVPADEAMLEQARHCRAIVVSRDRFREHGLARRDVPVLGLRAADGQLEFGPALMHGSDGTLRRIDVERYLASCPDPGPQDGKPAL